MCGGDDVTKTACFKNVIGSNSWESFPSLPEHREQFAMASVGEYIAVIGGFKASAEVEVFKNGHWTDGPKIHELSGLIHHAAVGFGESSVMVIGGFHDHEPSDRVFILDLESHQVHEGPALTRKRFSHSATKFVLNHEEYIAVAGGFSDYHVCKSVEVLKVCDAHGNIDLSHWEVFPSMNIPRHTFALEVIGNQLAAIGGEPTIESDKIEVFNVEHNAWEFTGEIVQFKGRHYFASVSVPDSAVSHPNPTTKTAKKTTEKVVDFTTTETAEKTTDTVETTTEIVVDPNFTSTKRAETTTETVETTTEMAVDPYFTTTEKAETTTETVETTTEMVVDPHFTTAEKAETTTETVETTTERVVDPHFTTTEKVETTTTTNTTTHRVVDTYGRK